MIEKLFDNVHGVDVYATEFIPVEIEAGQSVGQRMAVRRLLAHVFGPDVVLAHRDDGSPVAMGTKSEISVSHCAGRAVLAVGNCGRIGVDVELPRAALRRVVRKFLSASEALSWVSDDNLLRAWTIKEALYKATGRRGVDFANDVVLPHESSDIGRVVGEGKKDAYYAVHSTQYGGGYVSLAIPLVAIP